MKIRIYTNEQLKAVATTTLMKIKAGVSLWVYFSWGTDKLCFTEYNEMPTLMLRVSGVIHKGWVYVSLNEAQDLYEVRLLTYDYELQGEPHTEIFCEDLGPLIDRLVERGTCTDEEYEERAMADSKAKCQA